MNSPSISGNAIVGATLTANAGTWNGPAPSYAYQWFRCTTSGAGCSGITSATVQSYMPIPDDVGATLRVSVTASNKNGTTIATSAATPAVASATTTTTTSTPSTTTTTTTTPTTAATTTTAPTTTASTTTTAPSPAPTHWYSASSLWNTPIAAAPAIDPNSATYVGMLVALGKGININHSQWTPPIWHANSTTPTYNMKLNCTSGPNSGTCYNYINGVPIPANAQPSPDADGEMSVIDDSTSCEYDFWAASKQSDGSWYARWEQTERIDEQGFRANDVRAAGFALGGGLIRPEDVQAGVIPHALVIALPDTSSSAYVSPATKTDGTTAGGIPMGTHFQLNPSFDISVLPADQRTIAQAMKDYGFYVGDSSSAIALSAQEQQSILDSFLYPLDWGNGLADAAGIISNLRVIAPPPLPALDTAAGCPQNTHS